VPAKNTPIGTLGDPVLTSDDIAPCHMAWAPTLALADQVIFAAYPNLGMDGATFYQATEGDTASNGTKLFSIGATNLLLWYDWAPDGQSLLFVHTTKFANTSFVESNLFEYNLATGQITQLSNLSDEFVRSFSVSPNGELVVFERAATLDSATSDLWIMNRDGSNLHLLVKNGRIPNWSSQEPTVPSPVPPKQKLLFLPGVQA
jgi:Tol biopolymer transport system component